MTHSGKDVTDLELLLLLVHLARTDRDLYRRLRQEAWDMIASKHGSLTEQQLGAWRRDAS
jgi:hypothetical protein